MFRHLSALSVFVVVAAACGGGEAQLSYSSQGGVAVESDRGVSDEALGSVGVEDSDDVRDAESDSENGLQREPAAEEPAADELAEEEAATEEFAEKEKVPATTTVPSTDTGPGSGIGDLTILASVPTERKVSFYVESADLVTVTWDDGKVQQSAEFGESGDIAGSVVTQLLPAGEYTITVEGQVLNFRLGKRPTSDEGEEGDLDWGEWMDSWFSDESSEVFIGVTQWPDSLLSLYAAFEGLVNLVRVPEVLPPKVTDMGRMFSEAIAFNQDIGGWDTINVIEMGAMFRGSLSYNNGVVEPYSGVFNQDLSSWCVQNITEEPEWFDENASGWTLPRPVWGTCPS